MPRLTDKHHIRAILHRDPAWCVYALGDLSPRMYGKTQWFSSGFTSDLTLVWHDYSTSILFAMGTGSIREALGHVIWPVHLQVQREALDEVARHATVTSVRLMWRMVSKGSPSPAIGPEATRLAADDVPAIVQLFADGEASGESPDFFYPLMVTDGVFFGIYEGDALVAAAGTHLWSREENAAAIGNIYTRPKPRPRLGPHRHEHGAGGPDGHRDYWAERPRRQRRGASPLRITRIRTPLPVFRSTRP